MTRLTEFTSIIVAAYVRKNHVPTPQLGKVVELVADALAKCEQILSLQPMREPAVPIRQSIFPDYIVCLEDGKELKMLRRYLRVNYQLTPEEYRSRWNLPPDYPMVAPNYAKRRSDLAKSLGLGTTAGRSRKAS